MPYQDIVVVGASAGGLEALIKLVRRLPAELPAAIFVVVHFPTNASSTLPAILQRNSRLPAKHVVEGEQIQTGMIYVAPPNSHLILGKDGAHLDNGPKINGFRPSIDPLFESAASVYGSRVIGIILSGTLDDGTAGLMAIKQAGGIAIVQEPDEALFSAMPQSAIENVAVDYVFPVAGIARLVARLSTNEIVGKGEQAMEEMGASEVEIVEKDIQEFEAGERSRQTTTITCPDCGGVLWEVKEGNVRKYRCHVGHIYSTDSLLAEQTVALENALWTAVRALRERGMLLRRLATVAHDHGNFRTEKRFYDHALDVERNMELIRRLLTDGGLPGSEVATPALDDVKGAIAPDD